jgi:hypothetical protein
MIFANHIMNGKAAKDYYSQHLSPGDYFAKDATQHQPGDRRTAHGPDKRRPPRTHGLHV